MTPREILEAAGWIRTPLYQGRWTDPVTKISCSEAAAILTQLARDEAKDSLEWTEAELKSFAELASVPQPPPTDHLVRAVTRAEAKETSDGMAGSTDVSLGGDNRLPNHSGRPADKYDHRHSEVIGGNLSATVISPEQIEKSFGEFIGGPLTVSRFIAVFHPIFEAYAKAAPLATSVSAPDLAQKFHEAYERLAPQFGYETRKASAKPWAEVPENNHKLMTAVCEEILKYASSSSAAPIQSCYDWKKFYLEACKRRNEFEKRAEAAESKCAELQQQIRDDMELQKSLAKSKSPCGHLTQFSYTEDGGKTIECLVCVRDSRDRLQAELSKPCCGERHRMNHELKVEAPPSSRGGG